MTQSGAERYATARALVVKGSRAGIVLVCWYGKQARSRSLKVVIETPSIPTNAEVRRAARELDRRLRDLADRVNTRTSMGSTYYFV